MTQKEQMLELLNDTVAFYSADPNRRAMNGDNCRYIADNGNKCAFSRLCSNEGAELLHKNQEGKKCSNALRDNEFKAKLGLKYPELPANFYIDLQALHDKNHNWAPLGLSTIGEEVVERIKNNIETGFY